jgi:pimeloyl-ACP methyl ester carboxylesterase
MDTQQTPVSAAGRKQGQASQARSADGIEPFTIYVSPFVIEDLRERLGRARWPDEIAGAGWQYGANKEYLQHLCDHWGHGFDWKEQEAQLNQLHHYRTTIDGLGVHFIHERGSGDGIPILLLRGYPDSFVRFLRLIPLLTEPGRGRQRFDVVIPSMPGYGFSDRPTKPGMNTTRIAALYAQLMERLGYDRYFVHGGDWGSSIAEQLAIAHPDRIMGIHLTDVPYQHLFSTPQDQLTDAERAWMKAGQQWQQQEGAYVMVQGTKPDTLAFAVNDSPVGLAAWIIEKFYSWTDHSGDLEKVYTRDELLTNLTIYWVTQTAGSAFRLYFEAMRNPGTPAKGRLETPTAVLQGPKDLAPAPRSAAERAFRVVQWEQLPHGGHFLAMEQPQRLADDLFRFAASVGR